VLARFGIDGRRFHDLARGVDAGPPVLVTPPPDLVEQVELDPPVQRVDAVAFAAKGLADRMLDRLAGRGLACTRVVIEAETEHGERLSRCWRLASRSGGPLGPGDGALTPAALAERVRWQLDGWLTAPTDPDIEEATGGLTLLRLVPDEVVPADGRQLGFWGGDQAAHDRADRALARVQGMLGYESVVTAVVQGGRTPAEQVRWVPWGEAREPQRPLVVESIPTAWPGALPAPFPARVLDPPASAQLCDEQGNAVVVSGRGEQSAAPARVECAVLPGGGGAVSGWAGPWASDVRWWDPLARRRCARWQVVVDCGDAGDVACVVVVEAGHAGIEAIYD
jgi:protein ImuB